jgi:DNA polymerase-4
VGKVTEQHLHSAGIKTIGDVQTFELAHLEERFGRYGQRLYELARGMDRSPVVPNRVSKSVSAEDTFPKDLPLPELQPAIHRLAEKVWNASRANARQARTVVLKLKTREFATLTRSLTPTEMPKSAIELAELAVSLFDRVDLGPSQLFRLAGVGLSNFQIEAELPLLASSMAQESAVEEFAPKGRVDAPYLDAILLE